MELPYLLQIITNRKLIIILSFIGVFFTSAIVTLLSPSVYESNAIIFVAPSKTEMYLEQSIGLSQSSTTTTYSNVDNFENIIKSEQILNKLIEKLNLTNNSNKTLKASELIKHRLFLSTLFPHPYIDVDVINDDTDLIQITTESTEPQTAKLMAETLIDILIDYDIKRKKKANQASQKLLIEQVEKLNLIYNISLNKLRDYKDKKGILDLDKETENAINKLADLTESRENNILDIENIKASIALLKNQLQKQNAENVSSSTLESSSRILGIKENINDIELQLIDKTAKKTLEHRESITLKLQLKQLKSELAKEIEEHKSTNERLENMYRDLASLERKNENLIILIAETTKRFNSIPQKSLEIEQLFTDYQSNSNLYLKVLNHVKSLEIMEAGITPDIEIISEASLPDTNDPDKPNKVLNAIISLILGGMLGLTAAFIMEQFDNTIRNPDIIKNYGLTILGDIPKANNRRQKLIQGIGLTLTDVVAFRRIEKAISYLQPEAKSLAITSARKGEGTETVCVKLGHTIASLGHSVLLIDLDVTSSKLHELFKELPVPSVSDYIENDISVEECIMNTDHSGLDYLPAGTIYSNNGMLLESKGITELIDKMELTYNVIIINTPPILESSDALSIGQLTDSLITVVKLNYRTRSDQSKELELLNVTGLKLLGAIINYC